MLHNLNYSYAQNQYERLRATAREAGQETLKSYCQHSENIILGDIGDKARAASRRWLEMQYSRPTAEWSSKDILKTAPKSIRTVHLL